MRKILRYTLLHIFALITLNQLWRNLTFTNQIPTIIKVAFILTIFELILKPIVKLLLLPINILTLGTIRIFINTLGLYLAVFLLNDFSVNPISHPRFTTQGFLTFLVSSLTLSLVFFIYNKILTRK
jgi:uncharacterized membrane protein YvlD (DUF360 family)